MGSGLFKFKGLFNFSGFGTAQDGPSNAVEAVVVVVDEEFGGKPIFVDFWELRGAYIERDFMVDCVRGGLNGVGIPGINGVGCICMTKARDSMS